ncbi:MAG: imidazole glycerol phosphate synthase, glutamine amidotransferase subunit [Euryarchaeota archaeon RBG_16_67_27]|nr:MAG: imidazole glycerol phosphate synthase, glutamine amidotransferase subunit [Euryarchaeota archaeon RBG_16_67_27]
MARVTLVDSGTGNLFSLQEGFRRAGADVRVTRDPADVRTSACLALPGVASFSSVVNGLAPLREALLRAVDAGVPVLGICAGMQVLFESSEEGPGAGLGLVPGRVRALSAAVVPHMGWSPLRTNGDPWLSSVGQGAMAYFAHSFAAPPDVEGVVATADHGGPFAAAVRRGLVFGAQFHPEKSGRVGAGVLRGFLRESGVVPST